jgi:hypothetical protein
MRIAAAGLALLLAADAAAAAPTSKFRDEDRVIVTAEAAVKEWSWMFRAHPAFWTPALADALALEQRLPDYLRRRVPSEYRRAGWKPPSPPLWERAPSYKRQYVGIRRKGRRVIYANFFCAGSEDSWRTRPVSVDDGGDCYFQVEYDVDRRTFSELSINGDA